MNFFDVGICLFWLGVAFLFFWAVSRFNAKAMKTFSECLATAKQQHGLSFPMTPLLGSHGNGMVFDLKNRRALYVKDKQWLIVEPTYFSRWYIEHGHSIAGAANNFHIVVETNDFAHPQLKFNFNSERKKAQEWIARLAAFVNA